MTKRGVGTFLVEELLNEARGLEIEQVFVFTYEPKFFSRFGFIQVEHRTMPLKVYNECFHCPKFNKCDELAMACTYENSEKSFKDAGSGGWRVVEGGVTAPQGYLASGVSAGIKKKGWISPSCSHPNRHLQPVFSP